MRTIGLVHTAVRPLLRPSCTALRRSRAFTTMSETDTVVETLFARDPPPLEPKAPWSDDLKRTIAGLREHRYVVAALHLANDDIDACHDIVQAHEGDPTADLMHATLHRREGDYWNSKYWWNRLGPHPLTPPDAPAFVDACKAGKKGTEARQWDELKALVQWTRDNCH